MAFPEVAGGSQRHDVGLLGSSQAGAPREVPEPLDTAGVGPPQGGTWLLSTGSSHPPISILEMHALAAEWGRRW